MQFYSTFFCVFSEILYFCIVIYSIMKKFLFVSLAICMIAHTSCAQNYRVARVEKTRILVDSKLDSDSDNSTASFLIPYKHSVDSIMSPVLGRIECSADINRPESKMTNLMADIMLWAGQLYGEKVDVGVYNFGGIRSTMAAGDVTFGDVMAVSPFENHICFLTLTGDALAELFSQMAFTGGECVSKGVRLAFTKDGKLSSATLNGKPIVPERKYRIATIDFLAQGNDKMLAFKKKTDYVSYDTAEHNAREVIAKYFTYMKQHGIKVEPKVEGRAVVNEE